MSGLFDNFDLSVNVNIPKAQNDLVKNKNQAIKQSDKSSQNIYYQEVFTDKLSEFNIEINKPKVDMLTAKLSSADKTELDPAKIVKSKKVTLVDKLAIIKQKVLEVLGHQQSNVIVIKDAKTFEEYVSKAISFGRVAIDTETNNSTDPVTCNIMGLCLYYEGGKQAYIPINHVDPETGERLTWQLTEQDCKNQLQRLVDLKLALKGGWTPDYANQTYADWCAAHLRAALPDSSDFTIVMHNGKFDYEVLKCTCDIEVEPDWDTMICAHALNENEKMGLKWQYVHKIDPTQEEYDIESLFIIPYKYVDPEIFALYAATDSMMTDKLYRHQAAIIKAHGNEKLLWLFNNIEMPIVKVAADMELIGVCIDQEFGEKLKLKFNQNLEAIDEQISEELVALTPVINTWRLSKDANEKTKQYQPKKSKMSFKKLEEKYPFYDEKLGIRYKVGKAKTEQLGNPINLASPTQLAILFYDILKVPTVSRKSPRGTGKDELEAIADRTDIKLCKLILERRGIVKLISTYIDVLPALARHWPDGRIRYKLNSVGTDTGRFSSGGEFKFLDGDEPVEISGFNSQNIPSRGDGKITRLLFEAKKEFNEIEIWDDGDEDYYMLPEISEIETTDGWKYGKDIQIGDQLITDEGIDIVKDIKYGSRCYFIYA